MINQEEADRTWDEWVAHWKAEAARDVDYAPRLQIVRDTPLASMVAMLEHSGTSYRYSTSRACGGEAQISGEAFHCDVFEVAFRCHRRALVDEKALAEFERARIDVDAAQHRLREAARALPTEMRRNR